MDILNAGIHKPKRGKFGNVKVISVLNNHLGGLKFFVIPVIGLTLE